MAPRTSRSRVAQADPVQLAFDFNVPVILRCPKCSYTWQAATIDTAAWWSRGVTPETIARQVYCRFCTSPPPMHVVPTD
jgi:hypothetical protein